MNDTKTVTQTLREGVGHFSSVQATFTAQRYPGEPLLDTRVELEVDPICITWSRKEEFLKELAELLEKYAI